VLTNNENLDNFKSVTGERVPVDTFTYDQIPDKFTKVDKLQG